MEAKKIAKKKEAATIAALIFALFLPVVFATHCGSTQYPLLDEGCTVSIQDFSDGSVFNEQWFWKVAIFIALLVFLYYRSYVDIDFVIWTVFVVLLVFFVLPQESLPYFKNEEFINTTPLNVVQGCPNTYEPVCFGGRTYNNSCFAEEAKVTTLEPCVPIYKYQPSWVESTIDDLPNLGSRISPRYPWAGWLVVLLFVLGIVGVWQKASDVRDNFIDLFFPRRPKR